MGASNGAQTDADSLLPVWSRLMSGGGPARTPACPKWQDLIFHALCGICLAIAWSEYRVAPGIFDSFGCFALRFFSIAWLVVCSADVLRMQGTPSIAESRGTST